MSISQQKMDQIVNKTYNDGQNYKDLLAIFKNQRVNVPYIKYINGEKYWFVNGRLVDSAESQLISLPNQPQMYIITSAINERGEYIFKKGDKQNITVSAKAYENGLELADAIFTGLGTHENVENTTEYNITATYNNRIAQAKTKVYFVNPTYYGCVDDLDFSNQNDTVVKIKELLEKLYTSKEQIYEFTTTGSQYIVIAYPEIYGEASQIIDVNNKYNVINSFDCLHECQIDGVNYIVYKSKEKIQLSNYTIQIK